MEARLFRLQSNFLVVRILLALSGGALRTGFFDLSHDTNQPDSPNTILYGTLKLLDHSEKGLDRELPLAAPFRRLAQALAGMSRASRIALPAHPEVYAFRVERQGRPPLLVAWRRPATLGAQSEPLDIAVPWRTRVAHGTAIDGTAVPATSRQGIVSLTVTDRPVLVD
jgi:hypothetical protein